MKFEKRKAWHRFFKMKRTSIKKYPYWSHIIRSIFADMLVKCEPDSHLFGLTELSNQEGVHIRCHKCGQNPSYVERRDMINGKLPYTKEVKWLEK